MNKGFKFYLKLFLSVFYISAFTFGGGFVIVSLMRKKFVTELNWIDEKEMLNLVAIAQSSPGAIAINTSILIGYKLAGFFGALLTILGTILPPFITITVVTYIYTAYRDNSIVNLIMLGMQAGIAAVILDTAINMAAGIVKERNIGFIILMLGAFISTFFFKVNIVFIMIICTAAGAILTFYNEKRKKEI